MINIYEITYLMVCGDDGLISHTIKGIKEIMPRDKEETEEEEEEETEVENGNK